MFPSDVEEVVAGADASIDGLFAIDPSTLDQESLAKYVIAMHRLKSRMDAVATRATGAFDRFGDPEGAVGAAAWVFWKCGMKRSQAKAELSRSRDLRQMPEVDAAYSAGAVTSEHVRVLGAAQRSAP